MKAVYFSLAAAVSARVPLAEFIESQIEEVFVTTYDGFSINMQPYYEAEVSDYGMTGSERFSLDGENYNSLSWEITDSSLTWNEAGLFSNLPGFFDEFSQDSYTRTFTAEIGAGPSLKVDHEITMDGPQGPQSSTDDLLITASLGSAGGVTSATLNFDYEKDVSGFDQYIAEKYPDWSEFSNGYSMNAESTIRLNVEACDEYFSNDLSGSCVVGVSTKRSFNGEAEKQSRLRVNADDDSIKIVANPEVGVSKPYFVSLKSESNEGVAEALNAYNFWSVNFKHGKGANKLVIRVPLCNGVEEYVWPLVEEWSLTYITAVQALANGDAFVYAAWYVDQVVAQIPAGEFDCSPIMEASRIDSDFMPLNANLQDMCEDFDEGVQSFVQEQPFADALDGFRQYVRTLNSDESKQEVASTAQRIFAI